MTEVGEIVGGEVVITAPGRAKQGDEEAVGPTYRAVSSKDGFPTLRGVKTLYESLEQTVKNHGEKPALGWRPMTDGKAGPYEWMTYGQVQEKVKAIGSAILASGVKPKSRMGIFSGNTVEWMLAMQAGNYYSIYTVPLYDSLGENAVEYIVNHAGVELVFIDVAKLPEFVKVLPKLKQKTKAVVYWGAGEPTDGDRKALKSAKVPLHSFPEFEKLGRDKPKDPVPPGPQDPCTIMYTSGTTGAPKGVEVTHENIVSGIAALQTYTEHIGIEVTPEDSTLSYLPLAHIFDRIVEEFALYSGARIGYYQGSPKKITEDVAALRPTLFIAVPRVLERIQAGIDAKVKGKGLVTRVIFALAFRWKQLRIKMGAAVESAAPWLDSVVFDSVRKGFGGRLRFVVSGGAPLAGRVQEYLQIALCCPVLQGYGLTETCAASFFTHPPPKRHAGTVGPPLPATEFRFQAATEMGYSPTADPPRGEICIRGPMVFKGYFKMEDKTKESFDSDGFFHTGDIGELTPAGGLRIIDRMKNIFKLAQGEYIAVEKLETDYSDTDVVEQIWVYGNSYENVLVAVVVPDKKALTAWASDNGLGNASFEELCNNSKAADYVTAELSKTNKARRLKGFEAVRGVLLEPTPFSVEDDVVTPSMKLKRPQLQKKYQKEIDALYKDLNRKAK
jgi:long-chain acyl-CoA synthetase